MHTLRKDSQGGIGQHVGNLKSLASPALSGLSYPPGVPIPHDTWATTNTPMPDAMTLPCVRIAHHHLRLVVVQWEIMRYVFVRHFYGVRNW
jgi:hypothetical protein